MREKKKKAINVEIGKNIRLHREQAGYTREKFSELIGITPRFLADVETGFVGVSITNLKRICELLGISSDRLLWTIDKSIVGLDERVSHLDKEYIDVVERAIQAQLEVIAIATRDNSERGTRK